jgi:[NiFe] hydrogenase diaphorase moiety large subunit
VSANHLSPFVPADDLLAVLARYERGPHALVQILREVQSEQGWLSRPTLHHIATELGLTLAHVEGVAGFYRFFHTEPVGAYRILFSDNVTDRMGGSEALMADLCRRLGVAPGRLGADGLVSVDKTSCTGLCDQGPALLINQHQVVTRLDAHRVAQMAELIQKRVPVAQWPSLWFEVQDQIRRSDVLLGNEMTAGDALKAALARGAEGMLAEMKLSNLRGRSMWSFATPTKGSLGPSRTASC